MCRHSNSLYNSGLYIVKEYFKETNKYLGYNKLYHEIKSNIHYTSIPAKIAQQTLKLIDKDFRSFFALLNKKNNGQYGSNINIPNYKKPNSMFNLILPNDQVRIKNNILTLTKNLKLKFSYKIDGKIKQVIIKPNKNNFTIYITYEENLKELNKLNKNNFISIDLGINNFATCISNVGPSFIVNGKVIKSYNQFYNKQKAKIQSELELYNKSKWSNKLSNLTINRDRWIDNYFNQSVNHIIKYCITNDIGKLVIGYNETWKQNINLGKKTNQKFMLIPYHRFKMKLEHKCKENNIDFILQEESYTSKCSFIDNEKICKHDNYLGNRIKRGLFKSNNNITINADINGACNIARKVFSKFHWNNEIMAFIVKPIVFNPFKPVKSK